MLTPERESQMESDFNTMSHAADDGSGDKGRRESARHEAPDRLKASVVDTDVMAEATAGRLTEFQQLIMDEVRDRPLRALGWAAAVGVVFGFWAAK